jgi:hypothetical protein
MIHAGYALSKLDIQPPVYVHVEQTTRGPNLLKRLRETLPVLLACFQNPLSGPSVDHVHIGTRPKVHLVLEMCKLSSFAFLDKDATWTRGVHVVSFTSAVIIAPFHNVLRFLWNVEALKVLSMTYSPPKAVPPDSVHVKTFSEDRAD